MLVRSALRCRLFRRNLKPSVPRREVLSIGRQRTFAGSCCCLLWCEALSVARQKSIACGCCSAPWYEALSAVDHVATKHCSMNCIKTVMRNTLHCRLLRRRLKPSVPWCAAKNFSNGCPSKNAHEPSCIRKDLRPKPNIAQARSYAHNTNTYRQKVMRATNQQ